MSHSVSGAEYFEPCSKKGRGKAKRSLDLIGAMYAKAEAAQPITGRGIAYKLFTAGLIPSMARNEMQRVYRLLKEARERGDIPWEWIVDETRSLERVSTWKDREHYARCVARSYRRDFWNQQPVRVEVWSEKGTVRGVLQPVLDTYAVGFRVMHGFTSATSVYGASQDSDGRDLVVLYVGDYDPSGMFMSEEDLPNRLAEYGGDHITVKRVALTKEHVRDLPSFPASDKKKDPRYKWFAENYGSRCWELDAMDPGDLRECVEGAMVELIEPVAWQRCERVNEAEQESLKTILKNWGAHKMPYPFQLQVCGPEQIMMTMLAGPAAANMNTQTPRCIARWLDQAIKRKPTNRCLCMTCDSQFDSKHEASHGWSVVIVEPVGRDGHAVVSGMRAACAEGPDLLDRVMVALRAVIPDASVAPVGHC